MGPRGSFSFPEVDSHISGSGKESGVDGGLVSRWVSGASMYTGPQREAHPGSRKSETVGLKAPWVPTLLTTSCRAGSSPSLSRPLHTHTWPSTLAPASPQHGPAVKDSHKILSMEIKRLYTAEDKETRWGDYNRPGERLHRGDMKIP